MYLFYFFVGVVLTNRSLDQSYFDQPPLINRPLTNRPLTKRPYTIVVDVTMHSEGDQEPVLNQQLLSKVFSRFFLCIEKTIIIREQQVQLETSHRNSHRDQWGQSRRVQEVGPENKIKYKLPAY